MDEGLSQLEEDVGAVDEEMAAEGALPYGADIRAEYESARQAYETSTQSVLDQIQKARDLLLSQPTQKSKGEMLRGLAMSLAAPRQRNDPRFYEKRNLYTFLRDVGEYGTAEAEAQKKAELMQKEQMLKLDELAAKYGQQSALERLKAVGPLYREMMKPRAAAKGIEYSPSEGRQYVFTNPEAAGVAGGRAPQVFRKDLGYGYFDDKGDFRASREAPPGTRVVTSGALNPATIAKFDERQEKFTEDVLGLEKMQKFFTGVDSLDRGFKNIANVFIANVKNFMGKPIDGKPFETLSKAAQQQALLGALRLEVLGPGVLTEIDAQRLINTLGGDILSGKMNPDLVAARIKDIYKEKHQRANLTSRILKRDAPFHGYDPEEFSLTLPSTLGGDVLRGKPPAEKPKDTTATTRPPAGGVTLPNTKRVGNETWTLKVDARGNRAYVSPDGKRFEEVR